MSTSKKRKLPSVGIFDPNYSEDPQYGNVSTLQDGRKRIHFHFFAEPPGADRYHRFLITLPECNVPKISSSHIDSVEDIYVPVIKNFHVNYVEPNNLEKKAVSAIYVGLFEADNLDLGPFPKPDGSPGDTALDPHKDIEGIFLLNKPISYHAYESDDTSEVSNIPEKGYICLQNFLCLYVGHKHLNKSNPHSFNAYIDYNICKMKYKDALVWKADFEKMISPDLKYRVSTSKDETYIISRGGLQFDENADPSKFKPVVNDSKLYKVSERDTYDATLSAQEMVWSLAINKYL